MLGYLYLGAAVLFVATGSAFIICQYDPFVAFFRLTGTLQLLIIGVSFLLIALFIGRPYCRFFCPYGIILRLFSRFSKWRVTISPDDCIQCRLCEDACPYGAIQKPYVAPSTGDYRSGRTKLFIVLALLPVFIISLGWLGARLAPTFSRMHERVRLADQITLEEAGLAPENPESTIAADAADAFRATGQPIDDLLAEARTIETKFYYGGLIYGGFVGLIMGAKLLSLTLRRTRQDYQADRGRCLACGRCFDYCPREHLRRKKMRHG
jgi:ferredoxin